ncbi:hypothetical protein [Arthrobacter sp. ok362]|uniref:hypothetical protein n=1 Tax=Arthrobacter sp. ok362 TaxID=1761745 RepID=UPI00087F8187|nr:hypothetical protein [Arthrobacter sp. ok362]SDK92674.1 hypothetical protein SAMN04487913_104129 [Arthrobacter sp. ok362]
MSASDELAAIHARLAADEDEYADGVLDQNVRDRRYLLSLVQKQLARLEKVAAVASDFAERGHRIEEQFGGTGTIHTIRAAGLGDGYREAARSIRAALGPAVSELEGDATATAITSRASEHQPQAGSPLPPEALAG